MTIPMFGGDWANFGAWSEWASRQVQEEIDRRTPRGSIGPICDLCGRTTDSYDVTFEYVQPVMNEVRLKIECRPVRCRDRK